MKKLLFLWMAAAVLAAAPLSLGRSLGFKDWLNQIKNEKMRRVNRGKTMVAAVRGIDEPGEVDPKARDYEGVLAMEERNIPGDKVESFMKEGKLGPELGKAAEKGVKP